VQLRLCHPCVQPDTECPTTSSSAVDTESFLLHVFFPENSRPTCRTSLATALGTSLGGVTSSAVSADVCAASCLACRWPAAGRASGAGSGSRADQTWVKRQHSTAQHARSVCEGHNSVLYPRQVTQSQTRCDSNNNAHRPVCESPLWGGAFLWHKLGEGQLKLHEVLFDALHPYSSCHPSQFCC
jgi:hypothetical protein